jgi:flagellum-specific peptidoglycan hydrolase FlgJ
MSIIKRNKIFIVTVLTFASYFTLLNNFSYSCNDKYINKMNCVIDEVKDETGGVAKEIPNSIIIAQAILETGNGKSKAAKKKKNHFGLSNNGKTMHFTSTKKSVLSYLNNMNSNPAYKKLRKKLEKPEKKLDLIVDTFSCVYAQDNEYQNKIMKIINQCNLEQYD